MRREPLTSLTPPDLCTSDQNCMNPSPQTEWAGLWLIAQRRVELDFHLPAGAAVRLPCIIKGVR